MAPLASSVEDLVKVNSSVDDTLKLIYEFQLFLDDKLKTAINIAESIIKDSN